MAPETVRVLALACTAAALALGAAAWWLYRGERRDARGFRGRVRDRLERAARRK